MVVNNDGSAGGYAWQDFRSVKSGSTLDAEVKIDGPISDDKMESWAQRASEIVDQLRKDFSGQLPLNFHFVEDIEGQWHFLNVRPGFNPSKIVSAVSGDIHLVTSTDDLASWNRLSPIVVAVTTDRGKENSLIPLASALQNLNVPVFAKFGMLSHPALLLQAYGVRLLPFYLVRETAKDSLGYRRVSFRLDTDRDPITRIASEKAIYADKHFRVVFDREPIVNGHALIVAREFRESFVDSLINSSDFQFLLNSPVIRAAIGSEDYLFYERGRARFCTSGFTRPHAHAHAFPLKAFKEDAIFELAKATNAVSCESLDAAWTKARSSLGEYLVFGDSKGNTFYALNDGKFIQKRFVRRFLETRGA